ncbi:MAG: sigma 54-interacting transcriptional regulator [bacterium]
MENIAALVWKFAEAPIRRFTITRDAVVIGRDPASDVILPSEQVFAQHAKIIQLSDGSYELLDTSSNNATRVNGEIISRRALKNGDQIQIGDCNLSFELLPSTLESEYALFPEGDIPPSAVKTISGEHQKTILVPDQMDRTQNLELLQENNRRLMLLYEFGNLLNSQLEDYHRVLEQALNIALRTLKAKRGFIALGNPASDEFDVVVIHDKENRTKREKLQISRTLLNKAYQEARAILVRDALTEPELKDSDSVRAYQIRSAICTPLYSRDQIIGLIYLDDRGKPGSFTEDDVAFLQALCQQASIPISNALLLREVVRDNLKLRETLRSSHEIVWTSAAMQRVFDTITKVAPQEVTVLLTGENGTGKDLVARVIHAMSQRCHKPFETLYCALPSEGTEGDDLFGHVKGAFSGASADRPSRFELAEGGTILLNEIGDMRLETQAKMLRFLQYREFSRLGSNRIIKADVRIIAATNRDLKKMMGAGTFREDLYQRLNIIVIHLPPLRERKEEIISLAEFFIRKHAPIIRTLEAADAAKIKISKQATRLLERYSWPGNVRELEHAIVHALVMGKGFILHAEDLPLDVRLSGETIPAQPPNLQQIERDHIVRVLRYTNNNRVKAAEILGIGRTTLYDKIEEYQIVEQEVLE